MTDIFGELKELSEKAHKYDNLKGRYEEYGNKLREAISHISKGLEIIQATMSEIDPVATSVRRKTGKPYAEWLDELYNKMLSGIELSVELIASTYGIEDKVALYLHQKLKTMPKVLKRKEGTKALLYIQRNI